jgi:hypothetical protein
MTDGESGRRLTVTFVDGQPQSIRDRRNLVGSDFVFEVRDRTAILGATVDAVNLDGVVAAVEDLPFIDDVEVGQ